MDFELIKKYNEEIEKLLLERPEYREWFEELRKETSAGATKYNRAAIANSIMLKHVAKLNDSLKSLMRSTHELKIRCQVHDIKNKQKE